ncbi:MAG: HEPN domain-containing protein [Chitinophagaceae bacterium]|jgi:HEPN domain-containing protein|nr:MAG: HEPN domain-containing protein [Chitinophagaceae bacterium]
MNDIDKELLKEWLEKAEHDLIAASMIIDINPIILDIACFHCQQAVEKLLKTFLLFNGQELIKTHDLNTLLKKCAGIDVDFLSINIKDLNLYAVMARYPEFIAPELEEAKEYYQIALDVKSLVLLKIKI